MWALAIVDPAVYATPYILAIIVCIAVFSALILAVSSLRRRRKRNIAVYAVMALVLGLLAFQAHDVAVGPTHISYGFDFSTTEFHFGRVNQFNITSANAGVRTASYYLVLKSVNATFAENQPDYVRINATTIKVPFSFNELKEASQSKPVLFEINPNVASFELKAEIESQERSSILVITCMYSVRCDYNSTLNCYTISEMGSVTA